MQRGICPGCVIHLPHCRRFELDHILALGDDGEREVEKGVFRMKMPELREHDIMRLTTITIRNASPALYYPAAETGDCPRSGFGVLKPYRRDTTIDLKDD